MINFSREGMSWPLINEFKPLIAEHYKELAHYQDIPLSPNWDLYWALEQSGSFRVFTVRDDGKLVGYAWFQVRENLHYSTSKQASQDIIYLLPEIRRIGCGKSFIKWCDQELRSEGVQAVFHHVKAKHNFGPLLEQLGYELIDHVYGRRLD